MAFVIISTNGFSGTTGLLANSSDLDFHILKAILGWLSHISVNSFNNIGSESTFCFKILHSCEGKKFIITRSLSYFPSLCAFSSILVHFLCAKRIDFVFIIVNYRSIQSFEPPVLYKKNVNGV